MIEGDDRHPTPKPARRPDEEVPEGYRACAFCGKDRTQARKMVAGPSLLICDACVASVAVA